MLSVLAALLAGANPAPTLDGCDKHGTVALDTKLAADLGTTYAVDGTQLRVCVDRAMFPYSAEPGKRHGHHFFACYQVGIGKDTERFCGEGATFARWRGYRIHVSLRQPRFTSSSDVWLRVEVDHQTTH